VVRFRRFVPELEHCSASILLERSTEIIVAG